MLPFLLMLAAPDPEALMTTAKLRTAAETRCVVDPDSTDITVCGLRHADRFRVPFVVHDAGDPRHEPAMASRERLLHRTTRIQDLSLFLVGGGFVGVTVAAGSGGGVEVRKAAP